jgi:hypothetical protein
LAQLPSTQFYNGAHPPAGATSITDKPTALINIPVKQGSRAGKRQNSFSSGAWVLCGGASCFVWGWVFRSFTEILIRACFFVLLFGRKSNGNKSNFGALSQTHIKLIAQHIKK